MKIDNLARDIWTSGEKPGEPGAESFRVQIRMSSKSQSMAVLLQLVNGRFKVLDDERITGFVELCCVERGGGFVALGTELLVALDAECDVHFGSPIREDDPQGLLAGRLPHTRQRDRSASFSRASRALTCSA